MESDKKRSKTMYKKVVFDNNRRYNILLIGKRGTGKTTFIKNFIKDCQYNFIFDVSDEYPHHYNNLEELEKDFYNNVNEDKKKNKYLNNIKSVVIENNPYIYDNPSNFIQNMIFNGRCYKSNLIISQTYPYYIKPGLKYNFNYIFIGKGENDHNLKNIWKWYGGFIDNVDEFINIYKSITENNRFMVIDFDLMSRDINKKIFVYN
jgi:septin family protein